MDIKAIISEWLSRAENYFSTFPWKNTFVFLFFLILAFIFWLMLFFQKENVEGTYRIPLKYTNIPENVVFDHPLPEYIDVSITRSEEHTSELQSRPHLVCRLLLEKKN